MKKIAVIGLGSRMTSVLEKMLATGECELAYAADLRAEEIRAERKDVDKNEVKYFPSAEEMLASKDFADNPPDGICVGTRCSLHTEYAEEVIKRGFPLFLEKPVCTTRTDLAKLESLLTEYPDASKRVVVSFPLRFTPHVEKAKELIDSGEIGELSQVQAWNNVPYAIGYYHKWYRDENETGGLFLQKATHDFDYINHIVGMTPVIVDAVNSKRIFKGTHPVGLRCHDCAEKDTCPDFTPNLGKPYSPFDMCAFAVDTGNEDSGSTFLVYPDGMHTVYTQNFVARRNAGKRGARFIGHLATLEFDWYTDEILIHRHYKDVTDRIEIPKSADHFGGDSKLAANFISVMGGGESLSTLKSGITSAKLCLAAKESAQKHNEELKSIIK